MDIDRIRRQFWKFVAPPDANGCRLWQGGLTANGYGKFGHRDGGRQYTLTASRIAWELTNGPIPDGQQVLHRCDVRACCEPLHLFLGTQLENMQDCLAKGRYGVNGLVGEACHRARLNPVAVYVIRFLARQGVTFARLARAHRVTVNSISAVVHKRSWRHV